MPDNADPRDATYAEVPVAAIIVPEGRRPFDESRVVTLADSIAEVGLLQPVGLTVDHRLVYGLHRLEAHKRLGRKEILALILNLDDLHRQIAEIDENIVRNNLTVLAMSVALARRKDIYEALHPETRPVTKRGGPGRGKKTSDRMSPVSFSKDTAAKLHKHHRSVERLVKIGKKLDDQVAKLLADSPLANKLGQLAELSKLPPEGQRQVAQKLAQGQAGTVAAATKTKGTGPTVEDDARHGLKGLEAVIKALKACGIYEKHEGAVLTIKHALEHYTSGPETDAENKDGPNKEKGKWEF